MKKYIVTVYFVSKENIIAQYNEERYEKLLKSLKLGWNTTCTVASNYGINWALVTHYETEITDE